MSFEDYPAAEYDHAIDTYREVGEVLGYPVYTTGVDSRRLDALIGFWFALPKPSELFDKLVEKRGSSGEYTYYDWCDSYGHDWMLFEFNTWGATDMTGVEEDGTVTVRLGSHGGWPVFIELNVHTQGDMVLGDDISEFVEPLYDILLEVLQETHGLPLPDKETL